MNIIPQQVVGTKPLAASFGCGPYSSLIKCPPTVTSFFRCSHFRVSNGRGNTAVLVSLLCR